MKKRLPPIFKWVTVVCIFATSAAASAPYAAIVMDAETGEVLHEEKADTKVHPAGLTKLITLYAAFDAIETGLIGLEDQVRISVKAANEPAIKVGLRDGQRITVKNLVKAVAVQGANDAATALAEGIDGSEAAFAKRLNGYSKELGMTKSTWKNAHGLTEKGHLSTVRDIALVFAAHRRDYPEYFILFRKIRTDVGIREVTNSSQDVLKSLAGIKGAKYGYTRAAGFSIAVYVERRGKKVVAVISGELSKTRLLEKLDTLITRATRDFEQ